MVNVTSVGVSGIRGTFKGIVTISRLGLSVGSKRFFAFLKPDKYNGAAALQVVTKFCCPAGNIIHFNSGSVAHMPPRGEGANVIFRGCTLFPRVAIFRGITFKLEIEGLNSGRLGVGIGTMLRGIELRRCTSHRIDRLDKNRRRHITLTETLIVRPRVLLLSRPLDGLSTGLHSRVEDRVLELRGSCGVAAVCIARSRTRTLSVDSQVTMFGFKIYRRIKAPSRVCGRPTGSFMTKFVKRVGLLPIGVDEVRSRGVLMRIRGNRDTDRLSIQGTPFGCGRRGGKGLTLSVHPRSVGVLRGRARKGGVFGKVIRRIRFFNSLVGIIIETTNLGLRIGTLGDNLSEGLRTNTRI